jgi:hypothetical protein
VVLRIKPRGDDGYGARWSNPGWIFPRRDRYVKFPTGKIVFNENNLAGQMAEASNQLLLPRVRNR